MSAVMRWHHHRGSKSPPASVLTMGGSTIPRCNTHDATTTCSQATISHIADDGSGSARGQSSSVMMLRWQHHRGSSSPPVGVSTMGASTIPRHDTHKGSGSARGQSSSVMMLRWQHHHGSSSPPVGVLTMGGSTIPCRDTHEKRQPLAVKQQSTASLPPYDEGAPPGGLRGHDANVGQTRRGATHITGTARIQAARYNNLPEITLDDMIGGVKHFQRWERGGELELQFE